MAYVLRVGERATTSTGDAVALPIEGARAFVDGDVVRVLLAFVDLAGPEHQAIEQGPVELGLFADGGVAALLLRIGEPEGSALIEAKAPLNVLDHDARFNGCLHTSPGSGRVSLRRCEEAPRTVELVLCDSDTHVVQALRRVSVSADLAETIREAVRLQAATFACAAEVDRATLHATRTATVDDLMARAEKRDRIGCR